MLLLVAAGAYVVEQWRHYEPPFDHGDYSFKIDKLSEKLEREPCDRTKIIELADLLNRAGDYRATLKRAQRFFAACGEHPRLLWNTYAAYKNLSEFKKAAAEASKLIATNPDDQDAISPSPGARGTVLGDRGLRQGEHDQAQGFDCESGRTVLASKGGITKP